MRTRQQMQFNERFSVSDPLVIYIFEQNVGGGRLLWSTLSTPMSAPMEHVVKRHVRNSRLARGKGRFPCGWFWWCDQNHHAVEILFYNNFNVHGTQSERAEFELAASQFIGTFPHLLPCSPPGWTEVYRPNTEVNFRQPSPPWQHLLCTIFRLLVLCVRRRKRRTQILLETLVLGFLV